ncbi:unnamed protein product [Boreogadus saida]
MLQTILKCWLLATDQRGIPKEVIHHNHITLVSSVPMFKGMNPILLVELLEVLVFEMFETDKGAVKVETDDVILLLTDESFGELCLTRGTTNTSAKALSTFKIYSLSREGYRKVLKHFNTPKKQKQFGVQSNGQYYLQGAFSMAKTYLTNQKKQNYVEHQRQPSWLFMKIK